MKTKNILLVGVGGQGTITAAKLLTTGLMEEGFDVKMSEIHGMSQRGGSVCSQVRYGDDVQSPVIELGTADIIVAFEKMEAMRYIEFLKPDGKVIVNNSEIWPMPVVIGKKTYNKDILGELKKLATTKVIEASDLALKMGNEKVTNVILLGTIVKAMGLDNINWNEIIKNNVKPKFVDLNMKAMAKGMALVS
ncbi:MAG: indolepyruvate oxidoreductase subunit beta [Eubacteriaceae bacterium]|jgi:indolepyruvate ferredoxin oxidoreductase beta subunit|nr:indolepyruvate oxidoreductase subunit beta [Eubacteriaceae bacterium]